MKNPPGDVDNSQGVVKYRPRVAEVRQDCSIWTQKSSLGVLEAHSGDDDTELYRLTLDSCRHSLQRSSGGAEFLFRFQIFTIKKMRDKLINEGAGSYCNMQTVDA